MGTVTCQILVGRAHQNHGGIEPTHMLTLWENDRPAWVLRNILPDGFFTEGNRNQKDIVWVPTLENMLEDAILMIGIYVIKDRTLTELAKKYFKKDLSERIELYEDIEEEKLNQLYEACREVDVNYKLVITVLDGSSINAKKLKSLEYYPKVECEVCKPVFIREFNVWTNEYYRKGNLDDF